MLSRVTLAAVLSVSCASTSIAQGPPSDSKISRSRLIWAVSNERVPSIQFEQLEAAAAFDHATVAFASWPDKQLLVVSNNGSHTRAVGRAGDGPGEFRGPTAVGFVGDTLWVADDASRRITYFVDTKKPLRTSSFRELGADASLDPTRLSSVVSAVLEGGKSLVAATRASDLPGRWTKTRLAITDPKGRSARELLELTNRNVGFRVAVDGRQINMTNPYATHDFFASDGRGRRIVTATVDAGPKASQIAVKAFDVTGRNLFATTVSVARVPVSPTEFVDGIGSRAYRLARGDARFQAKLAKAIREAMDSSFGGEAAFPALSRLIVGTDFSVWLRVAEPDRALQRWVVLGQNGKRVRDVYLSVGQRILTASRDRIWVVEAEPGVPDVYRLALYAVLP